MKRGRAKLARKVAAATVAAAVVAVVVAMAAVAVVAGMAEEAVAAAMAAVIAVRANDPLQLSLSSATEYPSTQLNKSVRRKGRALFIYGEIRVRETAGVT
jgi:hypothetical protein